MKLLLRLFLILLSIFTLACGGRLISKEEAKKNALLITEKLDSGSIDTFRKWNFRYRGDEIWTKKIEDSIVYRCHYRKEDDTTSLVIWSRYLISKEFPCSLKIDTSLFGNYKFDKLNNGKIIVSAIVNNAGKDTLLFTDLRVENIFETKNPFHKIDSLSKVKDELKVYRIDYLKRNGDFIDFYITDRDVLTYIADESTLRPKQIWLNNFAEGIEIKPKWNLRHFDEDQLD